VEFGLLGPLTVLEGGSDMTPARPKQRALLALLLLRRGEVVPGAQLIEALWGEAPPGTAQTALYGHISALRKLVGPERIRTRPPGYLLDVAVDEVDLARFEALAADARARDDPAARASELREALALWRGEPLSELQGTPFADREIARLDELRVTALEDRIEADLALGRHHELVPELEPLVAEHPFRERLRGQLMLALYRCGRQAEALHVYQSGRRALAEELGIDPGPALRQLELRILRQDSSLEPTGAVRPPVRYARSGDLNIAYQVTGDGPIDLVLVSGFVSHLEKDWEEPRHARFLNRLGSIARLIRFDKRGTGLSDRPPGVPDLETRMDDVRAVMDAVGSRRAALFGYSEGAPMAILFAATYPERTRALILYGAYAKRLDPDDDYPWAPTREARVAYIDALERDWGFESDMKMMCPSADDAMARWWGERSRAAASPGAVRALNEMNSLIDVRALLSAIRVPTLVVNRGTDYDVRVEEGRYIAEHIGGARFVELPGADHFVGVDPDQILDIVEPFLADQGAARVPADRDRVLVTLVATEIVGAPTPRERRHGVVLRELARYRGRELEPARDRILASFDGPARAVRYATAITGAVRALGVEVRIGVHTGEVEIADGRAHGVAVDIAVGAAAEAAPGEVLVSQTVTDLVAGSGLEFADRGSRALPGVPGEWRLLAVVDPDRDAPRPSGGPMIGRTVELERLERALRRAKSETGSAVLIAGEAGIGKTRLVSELVAHARVAGCQTLVGRCLDLVGTELPYQPFVEALRPLGRELPFVDAGSAGSQLRVFEQTLALLDAAGAPVLLVLEDLHWADTSTLDLVAYLAHNIEGRRVLLLATYRADELASAERIRRLADSVGRSGAALVLELDPLAPDELAALIEARAGPTALVPVDAIIARSEGNPFFAEELVAAAGDEGGELPRGLRELLLRRVARLDRRTKGVLRLAAAAGRDVGYPLLRAAAGLPEHDVRESLRRAVEHGVIVPDQDGFRFRHALLAEAIYATLLPGEREDLHQRLAEALAHGDAAAAELAPHWAAAGRAREALVTSIEAAREAEAVFGLTEALAHLERALALWADVPDAAELAGLSLTELSAWAAEQAVLTGAAPRAVELGRQAIAVLGDADPVRAGLLHAALGQHLLFAGHRDTAVAAFERAVELVPPEPPSPERAQVLAALGHVLMLTWRHDESRPICEQALALAREVGPRAAEVRALGVLGVDLAYLGHGDDGLATAWQALRVAKETRAPEDLDRAYSWLTDVLTMQGRPRESARLAAEGVEVVQRYGIVYGPLLANHVEALVAAGEWEDADRVSAAALRASTANRPHQVLIMRAELEAGRGDFDAARAHLEAALATVREDERGSRAYDPVAAELALWEGRWADADEAVREGLARARARDAALYRVRLCAQGLRAQAELAALARDRGDAGALRGHLGRARKLRAFARRAATEAAPVTPNADGWRVLAEAEYARAADRARPDSWSEAAVAWERLGRPPLAAYCRWRQAEALVAAGATPADAAASLRDAYAVAARIGARPLLRELDAERARLDLVPHRRHGRDAEGLTNLPAAATPLVGREREVAELVAMLSNGTRLLTITGAGGTGKTRLALHVAAELVGRLRDGVYWVSLAGITDPELVTSELAHTIGARGDLTGYIRGKELLLLLDNFEHLLPAAPVVSRVLAASARARVLVTSRAPLHVSGEQEYRLEPLPREDAAALFAERARAVGCEVAPDATVEEICRRLDDLPLAIELAAARTRLLSPRRLLGRLDSALALLTTGARDAPARQRTLRATIEWSYDLLDPGARKLFARLSVFSGAFELEAAEDICGAELDDLATLVDYNLIKPIGDDRFLMLETIGSYAREKIREEDELRRRHAAFFSALAEQAYRRRLDAEAEWSSRLQRQHDDLRAALDWLSERDPDRALELAGALGWFWLSRGLLREGRGHLSAALAGSGMTGRSRARALASSGALLARHGDATAGIAELDAAVSMWRELGDLAELAAALDSLGWPLVYDAANNSRALAAFERSLELWRELGDEAGVTRALVGIAQVLVAMGETERAETISRDLLARAAGDARTEHYAYHFLADCALISGDPEEARTRYRHSLQAALALGDVLETGWEVQGVAMSEAGAGNPRCALMLAGAVEAHWEALGLTSSIAFWDALLERYLAPARAALGDEYDAARAEGRALTFDAAVALALNDNAHSAASAR
jgi:predicted ATPase/DNA-binding SARP family transcriptional activator/pimeloyl-ACP methyl ester carboxylesterase